jgi:rod shape-determining protein MreC
VVSPDGLVGLVRDVDARTSVVLTWAHQDFRASAMAVDGTVFGIVAPHGSSGQGAWLLELRGVPYREEVIPGTSIVTSGLGGVYPRGIPLGTVMGVAGEAVGWERTYLVRPAVHPAAVSHVMVLASTRATGDVQRFFAPGATP